MRRARKNRRVFVEQDSWQEDSLVARFELSVAGSQRLGSSATPTKEAPRRGSQGTHVCIRQLRSARLLGSNEHRCELSTRA